jgi:hypothetical protein
VIVFHGWINGHTARGMYVAAVGWVGGYPVVRGSRVRYEAEGGTLNNCRVRTGAVGASQGAVAAYIDFPDSYVDIRVFAPRTATTARSSVRGRLRRRRTPADRERHQPQSSSATPTRGWGQPGPWWRSGVRINAGWYTLRGQNRTAWPN